MSETPDDIAKEAWNVAGHIYDPTASKAAHEYVAGLIASALLAERERCAKCCEGDFDYEMRGYGKAFAAMIRNAP
jgi:hypothetical protein